MKNPRNHASTAKIPGIIGAVVLAILASQSAFAADGTWTGTAGGNTWKTNGNWSGASYPGTSGNVYTSTQIATFSTVGSGTIDLGGALNVKSILFGVSGGDAGAFVIGGASDTLNLTTAGSITVNAGVTTNQTIGTAGGVINLTSVTSSPSYSFVNNGSGTLTIAGAVTANQGSSTASTTTSLTLDGSGNGTISGVLSNAGTSGALGLGLTKIGSGTWTLSGANTYGGKTTVNAGTLKAGVATSAFGVNSAVTMANTSGATLDIAGYDTQIGSITGGGTTGGNVTLGANTLTVGANNTSPGAYAGAISGTGGSLTKIGSGTLILSGVNTYTGATTVNAGTLTLNRQTGSLATSALTMGGGTFNMDNTGASGALSQSLGALTFTAGESTVKTTRTASQSQALTFSSLGTRPTGVTANFVNGGGTNSATNGFNLTGVAADFIDRGIFYGGSAYAWMDAAGTYVRGIAYGTDSGAVTSGATTTLASATHQQITGAISAQNTATFTTLNISGNNDFTLAASQTVTVNGILKSGNTAGGAIISGGTGIQAATGAELVIRTDAANDALAISTPILANGTNALTKSGAGTLTLSGANTYTGVTTINAGTLALGSSGALGGGGNITFGGGTLQFTASNTTDYSARIKNSTAAVSLDTNGQNVSIAGVIDSSNTGGLTKIGSGALTLSGANTYTGSAVLRGGSLVLDYSTDNTPAPNVTTVNGTLQVSGKTTGTTTATIDTLTLGAAGSGQTKTITLDANGGAGVQLTIGTLAAYNVGQSILFDLSSNSGNSITVLGGLGVGDFTIGYTGGVLGTGSPNFGGRSPNIIVRDSTGYGFGILGNGTANSGTLGRLSSFTTLAADTAGGTGSNFKLDYAGTTAGTLTRTANLLFNTLTIDSSAGAIVLETGSFTNATGNAILATGANDVTINGSGTVSAVTIYDNYLAGTATLAISRPEGSAGIIFNGTGFTNYSGNMNGTASSFAIQGGILRLSANSTLQALNQKYILSGGAVMEIGADLNGATAGDLSTAIGTANGNIRFIGDSGLSAAGTDRVVNFGGSSAQITWGRSNFLTDVDGTTDSSSVLKLSSARSDAKLTIQNPIALGTSTSRIIDVANGTAATDAVLSGVISGTGATLVKQGAGTLELSAANTYSGATVISAGTLVLGASGTFASSPIINLGTSGSQGTLDLTAKPSFAFGTGQTLSGYGAINIGADKLLTFSSGSILAPGNSPGIVNVTGDVALASGSTTNMEIIGRNAGSPVAGVDFDQVIVSGTLTFGGTLNIDTTGLSGLVAGDSIGLFTAAFYAPGFTSVAMTGAYTSVFTNSAGVWTGNSAGLDFTFTEATGVLSIGAIPEPSTYAAIFGALALAGAAIHRRRRG